MSHLAGHIIGEYTLGKVLGHGAFSTVIKGIHESGQIFAIKVIDTAELSSKKDKILLNREMEILQILDHPNIVMLYDIVEEESILYLVFEFVDSGDLFKALDEQGAFDEDDARHIMRQIISALEYCHSLLIVHRDLKPENILLDGDLNVKIADFGLSNIVKPGKLLKTFCGSLLYASPEILTGSKYIGPGIDIWSLGVILSCLVTGRQPFIGDNVNEILDAIRAGITVPESISDDCVDLLGGMLAIDESERMPISEMRHHPWINEGYTNPPESYLPDPKPIDKLDENIIRQLVEYGFREANSPESRDQILFGVKNQLVVTYSIISQKKKKRREKKKKRTSSSIIQEYPDELIEKKRKRMSDLGGKAQTPTKRRSSEGTPSPSSKRKSWRLSLSKKKKRKSKMLEYEKNDEMTEKTESQGILIFQTTMSTSELISHITLVLESHQDIDFELQNNVFTATTKTEQFDITILKKGSSKSIWLRNLNDQTLTNSIIVKINSN